MIGTTISNYTIIQKLGVGGFGAVYKAKHNDLDGLLVAVKFMHDSFSGDEQYIASLKQECMVLNQLQHSNIVGFREILLSHSPPAIIMEFMEGCDVEQCMRRGMLTFEEIVFIGDGCPCL